MIFSTDIYIRRSKKFFVELKDELGMDYIDSYIIGGLLGMKFNELIDDFDIKEPNDDSPDLSLPRNVLMKRVNKLDLLWSIAYMNRNGFSNDDKTYMQKVFESNDNYSISKNPILIERVQIFHKYALGGVKILYSELIQRNKREALDYVTCIEELLLKIKSEKQFDIIDDFEL